MKLTIILITAVIFLFVGCSTEENTPIDTESPVNIPDSPPGFNLPLELGKLEIDDYTEYLIDALPNEDVEYSAIWTLDKEYPNAWEDMSEANKEAFIALRDKVNNAIKDGVTSNGGTIDIYEFNKGGHQDSGTLGGEWKVVHEENPSVKIWWVNVNSRKLLEGYSQKPKIDIFISHTEIR